MVAKARREQAVAVERRRRRLAGGRGVYRYVAVFLAVRGTVEGVARGREQVAHEAAAGNEAGLPAVPHRALEVSAREVGERVRCRPAVVRRRVRVEETFGIHLVVGTVQAHDEDVFVRAARHDVRVLARRGLEVGEAEQARDDAELARVFLSADVHAADVRRERGQQRIFDELPAVRAVVRRDEDVDLVAERLGRFDDCFFPRPDRVELIAAIERLGWNDRGFRGEFAAGPFRSSTTPVAERHAAEQHRDARLRVPGRLLVLLFRLDAKPILPCLPSLLCVEVVSLREHLGHQRLERSLAGTIGVLLNPSGFSVRHAFAVPGGDRGAEHDDESKESDAHFYRGRRRAFHKCRGQKTWRRRNTD
mmetsp:Transcript_19167/g.60001  ORF Transcript_19167/g.60001 Transcript_19167/m.60001 type:complete len:363 (+) Transcript_19167:237-1325(+)